MQPTNKNERAKAFWNFLGLFSICFVIILTMVFFSVRVPLNDNEVLRAKLDLLEKEVERDRAFTESFTKKMIGVSNMLDSIKTTSPLEADILEERIGKEIGRLTAMVPDTLKNNKELFIYVAHDLGDLQQYLKELRNKGEKDSETINLKDLLQKARDRAQEYADKYYECLAKK